MYRVTIELGDKEFLEFVRANPKAWMKVETSVMDRNYNIPAPAPAPEPLKPVRKRTSKINEALLDCLTFGTKNVSDLKQALVEKGLSANSLSTGLAALQKSGEVVAKGDGAYALATAA